MKHILAAFLCIITPSINAATPAEGMMMKMEYTQQGLTGEKVDPSRFTVPTGCKAPGE
jgi:hypothetical protein